MTTSRMQLARITEQEVAKLLTIGSNGALEVAWPQPDDDGYDLEVYQRWAFGGRLLIQVKIARTLFRYGTAHHLSIRGRIKKRIAIAGSEYWHFAGHFDLKSMRFTDPVFLIPAPALYGNLPRSTAASQEIRFNASMEPASRDRFSRYRLESHAVGRRVLYLVRAIGNPGEVDRLAA